MVRERRFTFSCRWLGVRTNQLRKIIKNRGPLPHRSSAELKLLWQAIRDIEDNRLENVPKRAGLPKSRRKAAGKLVEGASVQGWNASYGAPVQASSSARSAIGSSKS